VPILKCPLCGKDFEMAFPPIGDFRPVCLKCLRKAEKQENIARPYQGSGNKVGRDKREAGDNSWKSPGPDLPY